MVFSPTTTLNGFGGKIFIISLSVCQKQNRIDINVFLTLQDDKFEVGLAYSEGDTLEAPFLGLNFFHLSLMMRSISWGQFSGSMVGSIMHQTLSCFYCNYA